jgi:hypothetical protein
MTAALANSVQISNRYLRAFLRQPYYIIGTLIQPVIWLLLFGQLFKSVASIPGFTATSYITFLTPGVVVMSAMLMPGWMQTVARFNPVNWAVEVGRQTLSESIDWQFVAIRLAGLLALTLLCAWLSIRAFRAYQRSE